MRLGSLGLVMGIGCAVALVGCSSKPKAPGPEALEAQLQQEAQALKAANENQDANLGVHTTWTITSVDVVEQPGNEQAPWVGTVHYTIKAETADMDGKVQVDEYQKDFHYTFNPTLQKWVFDLQP